MIVNAHEHLESSAQWEAYSRIMKRTGLNHVIFVGSGDGTIYERGGFSNFRERNVDILELAIAHPGEVSIFPCLNPLDTDNVKMVNRYLKAGARGLKLYYGLGSRHDRGPWHTVPLDYEGMRPVFELCQDLNLPIIFHVNRIPFMEEQLRLLVQYPTLKVCFPHLMMSTASSHRMRVNEAIMDRFPNIFLDLSMGREIYLRPFCERITNRTQVFRDFLTKYAGRVMWGTDLVITEVKMTQREKYVESMIRWYRNMVERSSYQMPEVDKGGRTELVGLNLSGDALNSLYYKSFNSFIGSAVCKAEEVVSTA